MTMGVYCIQIEKENYWCSYVGISKNIEQRWRSHRHALNNMTHENKYLQNSWNKHGESNFKFIILKKESNYEELLKLEKGYAYSFGYGDRDLCFNIGSPGEKNGFFGRKHSKETKEKLSIIRQGENSKHAKLTEEEARFILTIKETGVDHMHRDFTQRELADMFDVSVPCVKNIMGRTKWRHIEPMCLKEYEAYQLQHKEKIKKVKTIDKLTEEEAMFILTVKVTEKNSSNRDFTQQELSDFFGVSIGCIRHIMQRTRRKHTEPMPTEEYEEYKRKLLNK